MALLIADWPLSSVDDGKSNTDPALHWRFEDFKLKSQSNENTFVGYDDQAKVWKTTFSGSDTKLGNATTSSNIAVICIGMSPPCIGAPKNYGKIVGFT